VTRKKRKQSNAKSTRTEAVRVVAKCPNRLGIIRAVPYDRVDIPLMGLSINPLTLLDSFLKGRYRSRDQVADFLDEVAKEARVLAEVWDEAIKQLLSSTGEFKPDSKIRGVLWQYDADNAGPFFRLREFYYQFSRTMEGKLDNESRSGIINHLGSLLYTRDITLLAFQKAVKDVDGSFFVENDNSIEDFKDLSRLALALHREAAALDVLAKSVRVRQG